MTSAIRDLRYALRVLAKAPGFAAVAVATLAIGIGANTAIFSVADALLFRSLGYSHVDRLAVLGAQKKGYGSGLGVLSWPRVSLLMAHQKSFSALAPFTTEVFNLTGQGDPEEVRSARVGWSFFDVLGVHPSMGRSFAEAEDRAGGPLVAIISHSLWMRHFGGSHGILGQHITLDGKDYTVIGVLPADFRFAFLDNAEIYAPRVTELNLITPAQVQRGSGFLTCVGRLRPDVTLGQARAEMDALNAEYRRQYPSFPDADPALMVHVGRLRDEAVTSIRPALMILFGAVAVVLLIACANVASLLLSRALVRRREMAVRMAVGATRGGIIRQLLTESLLLAVSGGILGALLSFWGVYALASAAGEFLPQTAEIRVDGLVLAFTLAVSVFAGLLFGLAPALQISRPDLNAALRVEGRGSTSGRRRNLTRNALVVSQVALSIVLTIGAGLLLRNFLQLRNTSPEFDPHGLLTMRLSLPPARYSKGPQMTTFFEELVRSVRAIPGVISADVASALPTVTTRLTPALPEGQPVIPLAQRPIFNVETFLPGYAETMRVGLARGREFTDRDNPQAALVAMVNETLARQYWKNEDPVGKHILVGGVPTPMEVVGVLRDIRNVQVNADVQPEIYLPFAQRPWAAMYLVARTAGDPHRMAAAIRARVSAIDRDQPVTAVRTMEEVLEASSAQPRFTATLLGALSGMALLLAIVGIYGVISYSVAERTQDMGIRMALGAEGTDILRMVLRQGLLLAACGIAIGLAISFGAMRLLQALLYHISVTDPLTFGGGAALFLAVAFLASYLPARRATRVDPLSALRYE